MTCWLISTVKKLMNACDIPELLSEDGPLFENREEKGSITMATDVTDPKQPEESQRGTKAKFQLLFEKSADAMLLLDGDVFMDYNQAAVEMMRFSSKEQLLSLRPYDISPEKQPDGQLSITRAHDTIAAALREVSHRCQVRYVTTPDECHAHRHASAFEWNAQCSVAPHAEIMGIKE
jgi:PAS domain-containing protein